MILPFPQFDCHNPLLYVYLAYKLKKITKILDFAGEQVDFALKVYIPEISDFAMAVLRFVLASIKESLAF